MSDSASAPPERNTLTRTGAFGAAPAAFAIPSSNAWSGSFEAP